MKPVFEITVNEIGKCEFTAFKGGISSKIFLTSHSLINLKKAIKSHKWYIAWIQCETGLMTHRGKNLDEIPYVPRY